MKKLLILICFVLSACSVTNITVPSDFYTTDEKEVKSPFPCKFQYEGYDISIEDFNTNPGSEQGSWYNVILFSTKDEKTTSVALPFVPLEFLDIIVDHCVDKNGSN